MPYFSNCWRCNPDNSFRGVDRNCPKCSGSGVDWRDDNELSSYDSQSGLNINDLRKKGSIRAPGKGDMVLNFTYSERAPSESEFADQRRNPRAITFGGSGRKNKSTSDGKAGSDRSKFPWFWVLVLLAVMYFVFTR